MVSWFFVSDDLFKLCPLIIFSVFDNVHKKTNVEMVLIGLPTRKCFFVNFFFLYNLHFFM